MDQRVSPGTGSLGHCRQCSAQLVINAGHKHDQDGNLIQPLVKTWTVQCPSCGMPAGKDHWRQKELDAAAARIKQAPAPPVQPDRSVSYAPSDVLDVISRHVGVLAKEVERLRVDLRETRAFCQALAERVTAQSEALSQRAERRSGRAG